MLDEDGHFYIIEMGYRLDGDMMYIPIKSLLGFDTVAWIVDYALGRRNDPAMLPPSQTKAYKRCGSSYMLWTNNDGVIASIEGLDVIAAIPGVTVDSLACVGDELTKYQPPRRYSLRHRRYRGDLPLYPEGQRHREDHE